MGGRTGRRRRGKIGLLVLTAITACGLVWGITTMAGASSSPSPAAEKVVFRVGTMQDIDSLNPFAGVTVAAYEMMHLNYDFLTGYAPTGPCGRRSPTAGNRLRTV